MPGFKFDNGEHEGMPGSMTPGSAYNYLKMLFNAPLASFVHKDTSNLDNLHCINVCMAFHQGGLAAPTHLQTLKVKARAEAEAGTSGAGAAEAEFDDE